MTGNGLPDYTNPPVTEAILGVQFDRIPGFTNGHSGAFWQTLDRGSWPSIAEMPPISPQFERFEEGSQWVRGLRLQLTQEPACRTQIRNDANDRMMQIQNDRFHVNWLGEGNEYPRFGSIKTEFDSSLGLFSKFLEDSRLPKIVPNHWEITYVNTIRRNTVWNDVRGWSFFKLMFGINCSYASVEAESFGGEWHFLIPDRKGRLHIQWQHFPSPNSEAESDFIRLTFTARGPVDEETTTEAGLSIGREAIVSSFCDLMTAEANDYWGLKK